MFEGDYAELCAGKFPLMSMGERAEGLACADPGARTPISLSGNFEQSKGIMKGSNTLFVLFIVATTFAKKLNETHPGICLDQKLTFDYGTPHS